MICVPRAADPCMVTNPPSACTCHNSNATAISILDKGRGDEQISANVRSVILGVTLCPACRIYMRAKSPIAVVGRMLAVPDPICSVANEISILVVMGRMFLIKARKYWKKFANLEAEASAIIAGGAGLSYVEKRVPVLSVGFSAAPSLSLILRPKDIKS